MKNEEDICPLRRLKLKDREAFTRALEVLDEEQAQLLADLEEIREVEKSPGKGGDSTRRLLTSRSVDR